jgi:hypothetical protein
MSAALDTIAAREWLAQADTIPEHAETWWDSSPEGLAILPMGRLFDAIALPTAVAARVLGAPGTDGPTIRDDGTGIVYILVPPGTSSTWASGLAPCLGTTHYLSVPAVTRRTQPGPYWLTPPDGSGHLTDPTVLAELLEAGARR